MYNGYHGNLQAALSQKQKSAALQPYCLFAAHRRMRRSIPQPAVNHYRHIAGMFFFGNGRQPLLMEDVLVISRKFEYMRYIPAMLYIVIDTVSANQTYRLG